jgi:hypothetical protein
MNSYLTIDMKNKKLEHNFKRVEMKEFVRCNWSRFEEMNLSFCSIDDKGI